MITKEMTPENRSDLLVEALLHYGNKITNKMSEFSGNNHLKCCLISTTDVICVTCVKVHLRFYSIQQKPINVSPDFVHAGQSLCHRLAKAMVMQETTQKDMVQDLECVPGIYSTVVDPPLQRPLTTVFRSPNCQIYLIKHPSVETPPLQRLILKDIRYGLCREGPL